ncbi:MAG: hypothetical protein JNL01_14330 [Bdellovibrionales bacterium]|nr:hypothetical protein [Bdellovibrionales bacterium]
MGIRSFSILAGISLSAFLLSLHSYGTKTGMQNTTAAKTVAEAKTPGMRKLASQCKVFDEPKTLKMKRKIVQAIDQCQLDLFVSLGFQLSVKKLKADTKIENFNLSNLSGFPESATYCHRKMKMIFEVPQVEYPKAQFAELLGFTRCAKDATVAGFKDMNAQFGSQRGFDMLGVCTEDGKTLRCDQKVRWWE